MLKKYIIIKKEKEFNKEKSMMSAQIKRYLRT